MGGSVGERAAVSAVHPGIVEPSGPGTKKIKLEIPKSPDAVKYNPEILLRNENPGTLRILFYTIPVLVASGSRTCFSYSYIK